MSNKFKTRYDKGDYLYVVSVKAGLGPNEAFFDRLAAGLDELRRVLIEPGERKIWGMALHVEPHGVINRQPFKGIRGYPDRGEMFMPWRDFYSTNWRKALRSQSARERLNTFLLAVEEFAGWAVDRPPAYHNRLFEHPECFFMQPLFGYLAFLDERYVDNYARMLAIWDTSHAGDEVAEDIEHIFSIYGSVPSARRLLEAYVENEGPNGTFHVMHYGEAYSSANAEFNPFVEPLPDVDLYLRDQEKKGTI